MLQITGQVVNVFTQDGGKNKDGQPYEPKNKVQLMGNIVLPNGETKYDLMDLTVDDLGIWTSCKGKKVTIEVGAFAPAKNNIVYMIRKGSKPLVLN